MLSHTPVWIIKEPAFYPLFLLHFTSYLAPSWSSVFRGYSDSDILANPYCRDMIAHHNKHRPTKKTIFPVGLYCLFVLRFYYAAFLFFRFMANPVHARLIIAMPIRYIMPVPGPPVAGSTAPSSFTTVS